MFRGVRTMLPLAAAITVIGFVGSFTLPYIPLFLTSAVRADPVETAAFLIAGPLAGVALSTVAGRLSDRPGMRRVTLIVACLAGVAGFGAYAVTREYWLLLPVAVTLVALSSAAFPLTFAFARHRLDQDTPGESAAVVNALRMLVSVSWVAGPPIAAFVLDAVTFTGLFTIVAVGFAMAAGIVAVRLAEPGRPAAVLHDERSTSDSDGPRTTGGIPLAAGAFLMMQTAAMLSTIAMSLYVTGDLRGNVQQAGWILAVCAVLEIPLMLMLGAFATRFPLHRLVMAGAAVGVAYFAVVAVATSPWHVAVAQILNAFFVAAVAGLGISYFQDLDPGHPGRATTIFVNTQRVSAMVAGAALGLAQHLGFRVAYAGGAVLCALGLAALLVRHTQFRRRPSGRDRAARLERAS